MVPGAAERASLAPHGKSIVVYGQNGAGKSSFVNAVEYVLNNGKVGHLSHEYSGRNQVRAVPNTHRPEDQATGLELCFTDGTALTVAVEATGTAVRSGTAADAVAGWDYRRTVLRQDEVSRFIHETKGNKYSALLPLLGLERLQTAAANLSQLARAVDKAAKLGDNRAVLEEIAARSADAFGADNQDKVQKRLTELHARYGPQTEAPSDGLQLSRELEAAIGERYTGFTAEQQRHQSLATIAGLDPQERVGAMRAAGLELADTVEPLLAEKLAVLQSTGSSAGSS